MLFSKISLFFIAIIGLAACSKMDAQGKPSQKSPPVEDKSMTENIKKTDGEWKKILTPEQYEVLRKKGTEPAFSGAYWNNHEKGIYKCAACGLELFSSETKYDSGCGWPSFWTPISSSSVATQEDRSFSMRRTEAVCPRCGGHLGHVFEDGPKPTGLRYCINSASLKFEKK